MRAARDIAWSDATRSDSLRLYALKSAMAYRRITQERLGLCRECESGYTSSLDELTNLITCFSRVMSRTLRIVSPPESPRCAHAKGLFRSLPARYRSSLLGGQHHLGMCRDIGLERRDEPGEDKGLS